jgi:RNase P/RNase MRP subunit POP5
MEKSLRPAFRFFPFRHSASSPFPPSPLDGLIVLGARLNSQGKPGRVARMRLLHALELWRQHYRGSLLILTGGISGAAPVSEARAMAEWGLKWAADNWGPELTEKLSPCLLLEEASSSTAASAANTLLLVKGLRLQRVGLVSDHLHLRRALFLFRQHFARHPIRLHPLPVPGVIRHYWRQGRYWWLGKMALREGGAWLKVLGALALGRGRLRR